MEVVFDADKFAYDLKKHRLLDSPSTLVQMERETGVSRVTYWRMLKQRDIQMATFCKLVAWIGKSPSEYFTISPK